MFILRRIVESALVNELKQNGVEGIASYSSMESKELSPENVMAAAKENQANGLMAVRLVGVDEQTVYHVPAYSVPYPYYYSWGTYYPHMHEYTGMPGYTATYKYYNVETNIYATDTEKLVWSAASQTVDPQNINKEANIFARKIVKSLGSSGLL